ncbi:hypothetical protein C5Y93_18840 [Blastopirellula marina]|uniref:Uncharacterized protein n=1 Tax=Blastopirellula marina TaxID=124 RepID=A0A2S8GJ45_9BACT|nr:hypothetical protein C5Y93_18840 [Blastopirellula marina]
MGSQRRIDNDSEREINGICDAVKVFPKTRPIPESTAVGLQAKVWTAFRKALVSATGAFLFSTSLFLLRGLQVQTKAAGKFPLL